MLKLAFIFLIGIAYAAQTRVKIGSKSWGYHIDLNQGQNTRSEFSDEEGIATGFYIYQLENETKRLEYRINPNRQEPDISFNVTTMDKKLLSDDNFNNDSTSNSTNNEVDNSNSNSTSVSTSNDYFDSIDSNQEFRGHITVKVGNITYNINFVTGDKSNTREETLTQDGLLFGRFNYVLKNSHTKLVINYKFNSTAPDPTFEVSLYKTIEAEQPSSNQPAHLSSYTSSHHPSSHQSSHPSINNHQPVQLSPTSNANPIYPAYNRGYQRNLPYQSSPRDHSSQGRPHFSPTSNEKVRVNPNINPSWYQNRVKSPYDP